MNYKPYPKIKDTPRRMTRKAERNKVWVYNRKLRSKARKQSRIAQSQVDE